MKKVLIGGDIKLLYIRGFFERLIVGGNCCFFENFLLIGNC